MAAESKTAVVAGLLGNLAVAITKLIAAFMTGSSAMLSEGIHSLVDTADQGLLLFGLKRSRRPPDAQHPLGHAHELYFWSFVVAVLIFGLGGGVTIYEGIIRFRNPAPLGDPTWNYVVLGLATVFESISLAVGYRQFSKQVHGAPTLEAVRRSKDPSVFTVVIEDSAALAGLAIAFLGVFLAHRLQDSRFDAAASVGIGLLLAGLALLIGYEVRGLLIGERADPGMVQEIQNLAERDAAVERANAPVTLQLGPESVLVALELQFARELSSADLTTAVERIEHSIRGRFPHVQHLYVEARSIEKRA